MFQASSDINEGIVAIGYPYSSLDWAVEAHTSWALPIDERWVASSKTAQAVGIEQTKELAQARATFGEALDIVACDGKYGNAGFLRPVKGLRCGITARLRADRVLYRLAPAHDPHQKGRPRKHGTRFAFKEAETWGKPDEIIELEDPRWEQVWLEHWKDLHEKKGVDVPYALATWMIFLARPIVQDAPFPWQKPQPQMTPQLFSKASVRFSR